MFRFSNAYSTAKSMHSTRPPGGISREEPGWIHTYRHSRTLSA